ncbi:hypothetical protein EDD11_001592 [Mortierella claussenii]|nr:hypothetical protein EDD11_001592 [Mortierella claussenii]
MPARSSAHALCTRILIRAQSRTAFVSRHQSTFSFFFRNQDSPAAAVRTTTPKSSPTDTRKVVKELDSRFLPSHNNALKTSSSYATAAPLLIALQNKDQDLAWLAYTNLRRTGQLSKLLPIHHTLLLRSIRPENAVRFTEDEIVMLIERFDQIWTGMLQCRIHPDLNDYTARLELSVATRRFQMVDLTWAEIKEKAGLTDGGVGRSRAIGTGINGRAGSRVPTIQPHVYTYNLILHSCVPRKDIGLALETITLMRRAGVKPDNMSWDYVLQVQTALKDWQAVENLYRSVFLTAPEGGLEGNELLLQQLQQQIQRKLQKHSVLMTLPLGQRARTLHGGDRSLSISSSRTGSRMDRDKLIPSIENVHTLFSYYAHTRDLDDLRNMFDSHVRLFGLVPTTRTYNEMMKFAFLTDQEEDGWELFKELVQIGYNLERIQADQLDRKQRLKSSSSKIFAFGDGVLQDDIVEVLFSSRTTRSSTSSTTVTSATPLQDFNTPNGETSSLSSSSQPLASSQPPASLQASTSQACGPDFHTFRILIDNELKGARHRWSRAWKWIQVMQEVYALEPSDAMFQSTLISMRHCKAGESDMTTLKANWEQIQAQRTAQLETRYTQAQALSQALDAASASDSALLIESNEIEEDDAHHLAQSSSSL